MVDWIKKEEVSQYLIRAKKAIAGGRYRFVHREANKAAMARGGILPKHVKGIVFGLTPLDYFNGPSSEKQNSEFPPGEYMEFGCDVNGVEMYVKLKLEFIEGDEYCVCMSLHEPQKPIRYPYKK